MTHEEFKKTEFYKTRPQIIKDFFDKYSPVDLYKFKNSGKECFIYSVEEPKSGNPEDITVTVYKTGYGGPFGFNPLDANGVFGVKPEQLEVVEKDWYSVENLKKVGML